MSIEHEICKRLCDLLEGRFNNVSICGNWLADPGGKGLRVKCGARIDVNVSVRGYPAYTSRTAELEASFAGELPFATDVTFARTLEIFETLAALLDEWHGDIASVKRDLTLPGAFEPAGLRMAGGKMDVDRENKVRTFELTAILRGRKA